jgi:hypothetical protein
MAGSRRHSVADLTPEQLRQRKESIQNIQITDSKGRTRSVAVDDLTEADKALAAEFGYKPVRTQYPTIRDLLHRH